MAKKIIAAGHVCIDITPVFEAGVQYGSLQEIFVPGRLTRVGKASVSIGGSVASTGLALKMLGADAVLLGKTGKDEFGGMIRQIMQSHGVTGIIEDETVSTSYSVVIAAPGSDRCFLHSPGANDTFLSSDISDEALEGAYLFHFGYPPLMRSMYLDGGSELVKMFRRVKEKGILTSLDMAAVDVSSDAGKADWANILRNVLPYVDIFVPSFEEVCFMADRDAFNRLTALGGDMTAHLDVTRDIKPLADKLVSMGAKTLLLKCGSKGMYYRSGEEEGYQPCFVPERIASATGAGDTSIAAFLMAWVEGRPISECARLAAAEGACCVTTYDTLSGLLTLDALEAKINSGWETSQ